MNCLKCGYALVGLEKPRCPECGKPFNPEDPATWGPRSLKPGLLFRALEGLGFGFGFAGLVLAYVILNDLEALDAYLWPLWWVGFYVGGVMYGYGWGYELVGLAAHFCFYGIFGLTLSLLVWAWRRRAINR